MIQRLDQLKINTMRWLFETRNHSLKCMTQFRYSTNCGSVRWRVCFRFVIMPWSAWRSIELRHLESRWFYLSVHLLYLYLSSLPLVQGKPPSWNSRLVSGSFTQNRFTLDVKRKHKGSDPFALKVIEFGQHALSQLSTPSSKQGSN